MPAQAAFYAFFLLVSAGISGLTAHFIWRRRLVNGGRALLILMLAETVWSLTYAFFWLADTSAARIFWLNATYFGVVIVPGVYLVFTLDYISNTSWITRRRLGLLAIEPILTLLLLWTDPWHRLFFAGKRTAESSTFLDGGPGFWLHIVYSYALLLLALILLTRFALHARKPFRSQATLVVLAAVLPWAANILGVTGLNPLIGLDLTPLAFTLVGLLLTFSLFRLRLLELIPIARRLVVDRMQDSVIVVNLQQQIVDVNPAAERLLYALNAAAKPPLIGQSIANYLSDLALDIEHTAGRPLELRPTIDGQPHIYRLLISLLEDRTGQRQGTILVLQDITALSLKTEETARGRDYLRAIFDGVADAIFVFDPATEELLDVNHRVTEVFGYERAEIIGTRNMSLFSAEIPPYTRAEAHQWFIQARVTGPQTVEWLNRHKDGTLFWSEVRVRYILFRESARVIVSINDITQRKQAEQRAFELALERERVQILTHFIQDAAHEFRTPLAIIQSGLYVLDRVEDPDRRQEKTGQIGIQVRRINRLVSMLASLAALDSGLPLSREPVELNALIRQLATDVQAALIERDLALRLDLAPDLPLLPADAHRMQEALDQLVDNALRHTPSSGTITVRTRRLDDAHLTLEIEDSGPGIPPEALPRVFERFYRQDEAHTTPGFGLGLPLARKIVEAHQGTIAVSSPPGAGTVVRITLPLAPAAASPLTLPPAADRSA